jgi:HPt (histidine-containing phosphotransfer) domain-containing protein
MEITDTLLDLSILNDLERRLGRERIGKVLAAQLVNGAALSRELIALEAAPDRVRIRALAHQVAGSSGSIGLIGVSRLAASLEDAALIETESELRARMAALRARLEESEQRLIGQYPDIGPS